MHSWCTVAVTIHVCSIWGASSQSPEAQYKQEQEKTMCAELNYLRYECCWKKALNFKKHFCLSHFKARNMRRATQHTNEHVRLVSPTGSGCLMWGATKQKPVAASHVNTYHWASSEVNTLNYQGVNTLQHYCMHLLTLFQAPIVPALQIAST